ncbi:MAG: helix-turn-helix domain-containing protein [Lentisphaeria bacterium]|nr:helix-turn-helix domain-containing protein [Lentisphaeria bacterium]
MEQDNEKRIADSGQPMENDLFTMGNSITEDASPALEAVPSAFGSPSIPEPEPAQEKIAEPEFKVNADSIPPVRMLNDENVAASKEVDHPEATEKKPISLRGGTGVSLGFMLAEARTAAGYSIGEVSQKTRILTDYLEAIEQDKTDALPNLVFFRAYVRALIKLYNLDEASSGLIEDQLADMEPKVEVPEKLLEDIGRDGQISEAETRKLKMILIYGSLILILLISLVVTSIVSVNIRNSRRRAQQLQQENRPFDSARLETMLPPQLPQPQLLKVPAPAETPKNDR